MPFKNKLIHYTLILIFILTCINGSTLNAITLDSVSTYTDLKDYTSISNFNEFRTAISIATNHLQPKIILKTTDPNLNSYSQILKQYPEIDSYKLECLTKAPNKNVLTVSLDYKQVYKLIHAQTSQLAKSRLNSSDLKLLNTATQIVNQITTEQMSDYDKELAIHDYIINSTSYDYDSLTHNPNNNAIYTAAGALLNHRAVCEGYSEACMLLLNLCHINSKIVYGSSDTTNHAWNLVELDNKWYHLDVTFDDPLVLNNNQRIETLSYNYFNVPDTILEQDHQWDRQKYPQASSMEQNYFYKHNLIANDYNEFKSIVLSEIQKGKTEIQCYVTNYDVTKYDLSFVLEHCKRVNYSTPLNKSGCIKLNLLQ